MEEHGDDDAKRRGSRIPKPPPGSAPAEKRAARSGDLPEGSGPLGRRLLRRSGGAHRRAHVVSLQLRKVREFARATSNDPRVGHSAVGGDRGANRASVISTLRAETRRAGPTGQGHCRQSATKPIRNHGRRSIASTAKPPERIGGLRRAHFRSPSSALEGMYGYEEPLVPRKRRTTANIPRLSRRFFISDERPWQLKMSLPYDKFSVRAGEFAHRRMNGRKTSTHVHPHCR